MGPFLPPLDRNRILKIPVEDFIRIQGARVHNLKNISLSIPREKLTVITGVSGSGKSSLAFDTIYAEGQRRYVESLSAYARQFLERMEKPDVDDIDGIAWNGAELTDSHSIVAGMPTGTRGARCMSPPGDERCPLRER